MSQSQALIRKHREYPSEDTEPALREIASSMILLDLFTLRTLRTDIKSSLYETFRQQLKGRLDKINHDNYYDQKLLAIEVKRLVRGLSATELDKIITRPIESRFYREAICLRIDAFATAKKEDEMRFVLSEEDLGAEEYARQDLLDIVDLFRSLYAQVNNVAAEDHLQQTVKSFKQAIQIINQDIEDACDYLDDLHKPLVDDTDIM